jgi:hypothetical protein
MPNIGERQMAYCAGDERGDTEGVHYSGAPLQILHGNSCGRAGTTWDFGVI